MTPQPNYEHLYYYRIGKGAWDTGDLKRAEQNFKKALEVKRRFSDGWQALYLVQIEAGNTASAVRSCREAVQVMRKYQWLWFYLGEAYTANKEYNKAILAYERALIQWKTYKKPMYGLIRIYRHLGNHEKVRQYRELMTKPRKEILPLRKKLKIEWKANKKKNELEL